MVFHSMNIDLPNEFFGNLFSTGLHDHFFKFSEADYKSKKHII